MRGYLWQDLGLEVMQEFSIFTSLIDAADSVSLSELIDNCGPAAFQFGTLAGLHLSLTLAEADEDRKLGAEWCGKLRQRRREVAIARRRDEAAMLTPAERMRAVRARRALEGKCSMCERRREGKASKCAEHLRYDRERALARKRGKVTSAAGTVPAV